MSKINNKVAINNALFNDIIQEKVTLNIFQRIFNNDGTIVI